MNEVQINEGVSSLTQREKEISSYQWLTSVQVKLSDVTLCPECKRTKNK